MRFLALNQQNKRMFQKKIRTFAPKKRVFARLKQMFAPVKCAFARLKQMFAPMKRAFARLIQMFGRKKRAFALAKRAFEAFKRSPYCNFYPACLIQSRMFIPIRSTSSLASRPPCITILRERSSVLRSAFAHSMSFRIPSN
jgi:hypothetical protein